MLNLIKVEFIKSKRTTIHKFIFIVPILTLILCALWGGGQNGAANWWNVMFLPALIAIISAQVITKEKQLSYKGILLFPIDKGKMWLAKNIYVFILILLANIICMLGVEFVGYLFGYTISFMSNIYGTFILICTIAFTIPISLFLTAKFNMFVSLLFNLCMTMLGVVSYETQTILKYLPYRASSALMVPILHIFPNGLPVPSDSEWLQAEFIFRDTVINLILCFVLVILTTIWFRRKAVN